MAWSFSSLNRYLTCPRQYDAVYNKKQKEPDTESSKWGERVHTHLESRAAGVPLPEMLQQHEKTIGGLIDAAKAKGFAVFAEQKLGLDRALKPVDFWAKDVWWRGKADLTILAPTYGYTEDYKTGKQKTDTTQIELISCALFAKYPMLELIDGKYRWLQSGKTTGKQIRRDETAAIWQRVIPLVQKMENDTTYAPTPNGLCKAYCHVTSCEFNGRYGR